MKRFILATASVLASGIIGSVALNAPQPTKAVDSPLVQEVQHQGEVLQNHEGRITNVENDVKDIQDKTGTPPSTNKVTVKQVTTPPANTSESSDSEPVVVVKSDAHFSLANEGFCEVTYSDGSKENKPMHSTNTTNPDGSQSLRDNCQEYIGSSR